MNPSSHIYPSLGHSNHRHFECQCPSDRSGTHCEYLAEEEVPTCSLDCVRGTCAKGFKSYDYLVNTGPFPAQLGTDLISSNGEHCVCPNGFTGLRCEIAVERCGASKYCYNGSTCVYDNKGNPTCDCNSANSDDKSYAGLSCEHEGTAYCEPGEDQDQKDAYCVNGGTCIEDTDSRHEGCLCPEGWSGDLCEIAGDEEPVCDLQCENGGSCRLGVKGYKDSFDALGLPVYQTQVENGMHCSCKTGFTGVRCEVDINHCHANESGNDEHFCLNGAPCSLDPQLSGVIKKYSCQCDSDKEDEITSMLIGRFCEYKATEFCSEDGARHNHSFCTNGGKCKHHNGYSDDK